ncbi:VOC family protein [Sphingomonas cannabina]|uniref:VOC family protein n=1 Tax=Sphingomonas cannabina TaxID=2899123 RepID=UPI001F265D5D|nr:VOC family protein [Sphingomonas cannabina]UIJ43684.1 VOC family protein [Sphingomonas cannabina]
MLDHIGLAVSDIERSRAFYEAALAPLGIRTIRTETNTLGNNAVLMGDDEIFFVIADGETVSDALHVAFRAETIEEVDNFHKAALAAGGRDNGAPGIRPQYEGRYYAAFALDPDGMNIEAVCHLEQTGDDLHHRL